MSDEEEMSPGQKFVYEKFLHPHGLSSEHEKYYASQERELRIDKVISEFGGQIYLLQTQVKELNKKIDENHKITIGLDSVTSNEITQIYSRIEKLENDLDDLDWKLKGLYDQVKDILRIIYTNVRLLNGITPEE